MEISIPQTQIKENSTPTMKELLQDKSVGFSLPKVGDIVEGRVIEKGRNKLYLDLGPLRLGVVYRSEIDLSLYDLQAIKPGDVLPAKIVSLENEEGLVELSLREAGLERVWRELGQLKETGTVFEAVIEGANRGGLIASVKGISAFLPVSQLSSEHYPHVEDGDKEEILRRLREFVGHTLEVKVIDLDRKTSKIILSERAKASKELEEKLARYSVGQTVEGVVSGIVDFGAFVTFDGIEGLIHISELGWQLVEKPDDVVKIGDNIKAKIIAIENGRVSLSLKALKPNPWAEAAQRYQKGDLVEGLVSKFNPFGAFVKINSEIQGLAHISEFKNYEEMTTLLAVGQNYRFRITLFEPKDFKMALRPVLTEEKNENAFNS